MPTRLAHSREWRLVDPVLIGSARTFVADPEVRAVLLALLERGKAASVHQSAAAHEAIGLRRVGREGLRAGDRRTGEHCNECESEDSQTIVETHKAVSF